MLKYWFKNRFIVSSISYIIAIVLISALFLTNSIKYYADSDEKISIFNSSELDFDIPSPSKNQIADLESLSHVEKVIPYYYTTKSLEYNTSDNISNVGIIFFENFDDIDLTMYNSNRLIEKSADLSENSLLVDYRFVNETGLGLNDEIIINFYGVNVTFIIDAIYETNTYYHNNVVVGLWSGEQRNITETNLNGELNYSGAYIVSNDIQISALYFKENYMPYGKLKERSEFLTDEAYEIHYNAFINANYENEITNFEISKINALENSDNLKQSAVSNLIITISLFVVFNVLFSLITFYRQTEYKYFKTKKRLGSNFMKYYFYSNLYELIVTIVAFAIMIYVIVGISQYYLPQSILLNILLFVIGAALLSSVVSYFMIKFITKRTF